MDDVVVFALAVAAPMVGFCFGYLLGWVAHEPPGRY
jgi:hypothetical protein